MDSSFWLSNELPVAVMALLLGGVILAIAGGIFIHFRERSGRRK